MVQRDKKGKPLRDKAGRTIPLTSHTLAPVPIAIGGAIPHGVTIKTSQELPKAGLANVTATIINLLGLESPAEYEPSLLSFDESVAPAAAAAGPAHL